MATDPITWPVAFTIFGGIVVAAITVAGFLIQNFKQSAPWKDPVSKLNTTVVRLETEMQTLTNKIENNEKELINHDIRNERDFERLHERLEKITDLMIKMLSEDSQSESQKPKKDK